MYIYLVNFSFDLSHETKIRCDMVDLYYALYGNKTNSEHSFSKTTKLQKLDYKQLFVPASESKSNISTLKRVNDDFRKNSGADNSDNISSLEPLAKKMKPKHNESFSFEKGESALSEKINDAKSKLDKDKIKKKKKDKKKHKHRHKHKHNKEKEKNEKKDKKISNVNIPTIKAEDILLESTT